MSQSPANAIGVNLLSSVAAASFEQDGKGFALGDHVLAGGGYGDWWFCKAATALAIGSVVGIDKAWLATLVTKAIADAGSRIGVCPIAVASGDYFWAQTSGTIDNMGVLASCAIDVPLYTSATAGSLDDTATSQTKVIGVKLSTARGGTDGVAPALGYNGGINCPL